MQGASTRRDSDRDDEASGAQPVDIRSRVAAFENLQATNDDGSGGGGGSSVHTAISPKPVSHMVRRPAPTYSQGMSSRNTSGPSAASAAAAATWAVANKSARDSPYGSTSTWRGSSSSSDLPSTSAMNGGSNGKRSSLERTESMLIGAPLRKSGSGMSLNDLAASRDGHDGGEISPGYRRGSGDTSPSTSRTNSPRLGVRNIIALYGGQGSQAAESSLSRSRTSSTQQMAPPPSTEATFLRPTRLPRHMLDTSDDGSASLSLHPSLSPTMAPPSPSLLPAFSPSSPSTVHPLRRMSGMSASASADNLLPKSSSKPPAPPRPAKPTASTSPSSGDADSARPSLYDLNLQPPTPSRRTTVRGAAATSLRRSTSGSPSRQGHASQPPPVLPPRKMTMNSNATTSPPTSYAPQVPRGRHGPSNSTGSVPALPPRGDMAWDASPSLSSEGPPAPPPRPRNGVSPSNSTTSVNSDASVGSSSMLPPPPRHRLPAPAIVHRSTLSGSGSDLSRAGLTDPASSVIVPSKPATQTSRGFTLGTDASEDLRNSLQNEIGDRAQLVQRAGAVESTPRGVPRPAPPKRSGTITPARRSLSPTPMASSRSGDAMGRGRASSAAGTDPAARSRLSRSPDRSARTRYEKLFDQQVALKCERSRRMKSTSLAPAYRQQGPTQATGGARATAIPIGRGAPASPLLGSSTSHSAPNAQSLVVNGASFGPSSMGYSLSANGSDDAVRLGRKRVQRLWAASRLDESFLRQVWDAAVASEAHDGISSERSLGREAFVRALAAIDAELAQRSERRRRRSGGRYSAASPSTLHSQAPRGLASSRGSNWASALRLPAAAASAVKAFTDAGAPQSRSSSAGHVERRLPPPAPV